MRAILSFTLFTMLGLLVPWQNLTAENVEWRKNTHLLPQYCKDRIDPNRWTKWRKTFGKAYIHMHHYCDGVYREKKARLASEPGELSYQLRLVVHQMHYVSGSCQPGCVLYPELHSRWGWALGKQGQLGEAIKHYQLAIQNKPTYTRAYAELSDLYVKYNEHDEARKVLEVGLKASPKSRKLQRRLRKLRSPE